MKAKGQIIIEKNLLPFIFYYIFSCNERFEKYFNLVIFVFFGGGLYITKLYIIKNSERRREMA